MDKKLLVKSGTTEYDIMARTSSALSLIFAAGKRPNPFA
jgi:hypothetical protein